MVKINLLKITASVIVVISLADKIISLCQGYVAKMKDAHSKLRAIIVKVKSLKTTVTNLEYFLSTWSIDNMLYIVKSFEGSKGSLKVSKQAVVALEKLFPSAIDLIIMRAKHRAMSIFHVKLA